MKFAVTRKIGMTRIFDSEGNAVAVSALLGVGAKVYRVKSQKSDGYNSVVIKVDSKKDKYLEFKLDKDGAFKVNDPVDIKSFKSDDLVQISGYTKGKGFSGVIKRHGFSRGPKTHGSEHHRSTGAIGGAYPQRVVKGKKMPGRMGATKSVQKNLKVIDFLEKENIILVSGSVPGPKGRLLKLSSIE